MHVVALAIYNNKLQIYAYTNKNAKCNEKKTTKYSLAILAFVVVVNI